LKGLRDFIGGGCARAMRRDDFEAGFEETSQQVGPDERIGPGQ
jgi:hypothetical protein